MLKECSSLFLDEVCTIEISIRNGRYTPKQQVYYPDQQIRFECDPGYELDRLSPVQTCLKNGSWSSVELPRCLSKKTVRSYGKNEIRFPSKGLSVVNHYQYRMPIWSIRHPPMLNMLVSKDLFSKIHHRESNVIKVVGKRIDRNVSKPCVDIRPWKVSMVMWLILVQHFSPAKAQVYHAIVRQDLISFLWLIMSYVIIKEYGNHHYRNVMVFSVLQFDFYPLITLGSFAYSLLAKCRLPDLGRNLIAYYMDDMTNEWYGKELQAGAYIRHGSTIKYQCQCSTKSMQNCSSSKPSFTQCLDGQWTNNGPQCREGRTREIFFFLFSPIS